MKVHLVDRDGTRKEYDCEYVEEGDSGIYLMSRPSSKAEFAMGYVPFDRLDYVEPTGADR